MLEVLNKQIGVGGATDSCGVMFDFQQLKPADRYADKLGLADLQRERDFSLRKVLNESRGGEMEEQW